MYHSSRWFLTTAAVSLHSSCHIKGKYFCSLSTLLLCAFKANKYTKKNCYVFKWNEEVSGKERFSIFFIFLGEENFLFCERKFERKFHWKFMYVRVYWWVFSRSLSENLSFSLPLRSFSQRGENELTKDEKIRKAISVTCLHSPTIQSEKVFCVRDASFCFNLIIKQRKT